jgi:hypothetical protein
MKRVLIFVLICLFGSKLYAGHSIGGYITYKHLGALKYEITVTIYRDCRGIPLSGSAITAEMLGDGKAKANLSLTLVAINDVSAYCKSYGKACNPTNQTISGTNPSVEEHLFKDTVDFNAKDSAFKKYCSIKFGAGICCRSGAITTGPANSDFWVWSELNICKALNNSSSLITALPNNILCCNQPFYTNFGVIDSVDRDSLSYEFTDPMQNWTTKASYNGSYKNYEPISTYYPTGYDKSKGPKPDANPPIGLYLDPETGDLIFTPTDCSEYTVLCVNIKEWRKDSTGKYQNIGEVRRDLNYFVMSCTGNNPALLYGPYKYSTCPNTQICFNVTSDDKPYTPPPPAKASPPDTVSLTWNFGIQRGATFTIVNKQARLQTGKFCWTPKESDASPIPYTFTVTANDNFCPKSSITIKSYSVLVKKKSSTKLAKRALSTNVFEYSSTISSDFLGTPSYFTELLDTSMKPLNAGYYFFLNDNVKRSSSIKAKDTIYFRKPGKYYLHHRINNAPLNCPTDYFDTIVVSSAYGLLLMGNDTALCPGQKMSYKAYADGGKIPYTYQWNNLKPDTNTVFEISAIKDTAITLIVTDANGLKVSEKRFITVRKSDIAVTAGPDRLVCKNDSFVLFAKPLNIPDSAKYEWQYGGKTFSYKQQLTAKNIGTYIVKINDRDYCFSNYDTIQIRDTSVTTFAGNDKEICLGNSITLRANNPQNTGTNDFRWYQVKNGGTNTSISNKDTVVVKPVSTTMYFVRQTTNLGALSCITYDSVLITINPLPVVDLKRFEVCQSDNELDLSTLVVSPSDYAKGTPTWKLLRTLPKPSGGNNSLSDLAVLNGNKYILKVDENTIKVPGTYEDSIQLKMHFKSDIGCESTNDDSTFIKIKTNVKISLGKPFNTICYGDTLKKLSDSYAVNYSGGKWYTKNDTSSATWPQGDNIALGELVASKGLNNVSKTYLLKYELENQGCFSTAIGKLQVVPFPVINWSQKIVGDSVTLTDNSTNAGTRTWFLNNSFYSSAKSITLSKFIAGSKTILLKSANGNCTKDSVIVPQNLTGSIGSIGKNNLLVYPNPFTNNLLVSVKETGYFTGEIFNSVGQSVLRFSGQNSEIELQLDVLPAGMYRIVVNVNGKLLQTGITKQNR